MCAEAVSVFGSARGYSVLCCVSVFREVSPATESSNSHMPSGMAYREESSLHATGVELLEPTAWGLIGVVAYGCVCGVFWYFLCSKVWMGKRNGMGEEGGLEGEEGGEEGRAEESRKRDRTSKETNQNKTTAKTKRGFLRKKREKEELRATSLKGSCRKIAEQCLIVKIAHVIK